MSPSGWSVFILAFSMSIITLLCLVKDKDTIKQFIYNVMAAIFAVFLILGWYLQLRDHTEGSSQIGVTLVFSAMSFLVILMSLKNK